MMEGIEYTLQNGASDVEITGITNDSRKVEPGYLFCCVPGFKLDGHDFIGQAIDRGAAAIVVERSVSADDDVTVIKVADIRTVQGRLAAKYFGNRHNRLKLVGITGTNGKTTTAYLLENIIRSAGHKSGLIGTIEYRIGDKKTPALRTTPDSIELNWLLAQMEADSVDMAVMEVSSHAIDLARIDDVEFNVVVFTNLSQDHLDYHDDIEAYFKAKSRLFTMHEGRKSRPLFCINLDDEYGRRLIDMLGGVDYTFGLEERADVVALDVDIQGEGASFLLKTPLGSEMVYSPMPGTFNVYNVLAATSAALALGFSLEEIIGGISAKISVPGRFEVIDCQQEFMVAVDYAHTPDGLENVLTLAKEIAKGHRIITVFGCGGDRDHGKRPLMGRAVERLSDYFIITSDNPRSEEPMAIINDIVAGIGTPGTGYAIEPDRRRAIRAAMQAARPGDVVIIAGKGHESMQEFKDRIEPFSDSQVCGEILRELGLCRE